MKHKHLQDTYSLNETLCLPGEDEYQAHAQHCVPECELKPFRHQALPLPRRPQATPSPLKPPADEDHPAISKMPHPTMIRTPQPPQEPSFASPTKKQVAIVLPSQGSGSAAPFMHKHQHDQEALKASPATKTNKKVKLVEPKVPSKAGPAKATASKAASKTKNAPVPSKQTSTVKKPVLIDPSSDSKADSEEDDAATGEAPAPADEDALSDKIEVPPIKRPRLASVANTSPPPPHAYHPLTGEPLTGLLYISLAAPSDPVPPLSPAGPSAKAKGKQKATAKASPPPVSAPKRSRSSHGKQPLPLADAIIDETVIRDPSSSALEADNIDNMIYARAFHPQIDLQFHEPPSRQALEYMKLSMLPSMPDSLTKPVSQIRNSREYMYRCHSDLDPHFIRPPLLTWPCYNCTLSGFPNECIFEGEVGEEVCTKCKTNRHGPCSACWDANQLHWAATLLDPLTLSGDGALRRGVNQVKHLNTEIKLLGEAMQLLREDREQIIGELADGLDAIASHEHGTEIIDAHAQVSSFLGSFTVRLGEVNTGSEGNESASGSSAV
ncbi:hypothetical protein ARMSODRAFT_983275 [Armillaria solidipes]|uniref:Uncharacterized protein n=1 Tax=Armillaria solidipes TaxID=1076256 RepID=A0A2H3B7U8_9AGAR|nr:hypothetical protein ARMSODRAFT_983275 [Armillaria solidipes]